MRLAFERLLAHGAAAAGQDELLALAPPCASQVFDTCARVRSCATAPAPRLRSWRRPSPGRSFWPSRDAAATQHRQSRADASEHAGAHGLRAAGRPELPGALGAWDGPGFRHPDLALVEARGARVAAPLRVLILPAAWDAGGGPRLASEVEIAPRTDA